MAAAKRQAKEVSRRLLVEAALESLAEKGLGAVSVRDVAMRAGVTQGLIRHHFGSFDALLEAAYRHATERVDQVLEQALDRARGEPQARMDAFLEASFSPAIVDRRLLAAWLGFWGLVRADPRAAAVHAETYAAYRRRIESLLDALARHRGRRVDARAGALGLSAMLDGLWLELCLDPGTFSAEEAVGIARAHVDNLFHAAPAV